jgi:hypothetical protein
MGKKSPNFETVREIAFALPDVRESTIHGFPSLKVADRLLACPALHKSAEPNSLMLRIGIEQRAVLLKSNPSRYYVTDHYVKYPSVLVRLPEMDRQSLRDLLRLSWEFVTAQVASRKRRAPQTKRELISPDTSES